jgi:disulfide bond formation protein DsbB
VSLLTVATFLALLALVAGAGSIGLIGLAVGARWSDGASSAYRSVSAALAPFGLWLAFAVAATATAGSLYFSEIGHLVPCTLCWYQRIAMYPLAIILGLAAWRGDSGVRRYATVLAAIGAVVAAYHIALQRLPGLPSGACSLEAPCSAIELERFGFVTIPVMAFIGFMSIIVVLTLLTDRRSPTS